MVLLIAVGLQVPLVWALGRLSGHPGAVVAVAGVLTGAFLSGFFGPRSLWGEPGKLRLYLGMWPFFVWWTAALLFALVVPLAFGAVAILPVSTNAALAAAVGIAALITAVAFRHRVSVRDREVFITDLPVAFEGYRVVQISDLHCGPFASERRVARWVASTNRLNGDLIAVTGDLIASGGAFVTTVASALGALSARDGVFASMGNHDYFAEGDAMAEALHGAGLSVLRNRGVEIERDGAKIFVAGVDDTWTRRHDVKKALVDRPDGTPVVLLAHDPALFPEAASLGVDLTLSGHTHGGQLGVPFFSRRWNLARVMTRFTSGVYTEGTSTLYVNHGLGTTGVPIRLLVSSEIAVLTLRRAA
jgi:predicted MPP superfamily phosphohydrolase